MIDAKPLPDRPGAGVDVDEWSLHHRFLYRLVLGASGSTTEELQMLYETLAPLVYKGTTSMPCSSRRWRRELLYDLRDAGLVVVHETPRGWVGVPSDDVADLDNRGESAPAMPAVDDASD